MVEITRVLDQELSYFHCTENRTHITQYRYGTAKYSNYGGLIISHRTADSSPPLSETVSVPFGTFTQGKQRWGRLRDKDVRHVSARGSLVLEGLGAYSSTTYDVTIGNEIFQTRQYLVGSTPYYAVGVAQWGVPFTWSGIWNVPETVSGSNIRGAHWERVNMALIFSPLADYALLKVWLTVGPMRNKLNGVWVDWPEQEYKEPRVSFIKRVFVGGEVQLQSYTAGFASTGSVPYQSFKVVLPTGQYPLSSLSPNPILYNITSWTGTCSPRIGKSSTGSGGSLSAFEYLRTVIPSPNFRDSIYHVFKQAPVDLDWGTLGGEVIKSKDYVDANILLTAYDLTHLKADLDNWKGLANAFRELSSDLPRVAKELNTPAKLLKNKSLAGSTALSWSKLFSGSNLSTKYGVLPTVRDTQALYHGMRAIATLASIPDRRHSRHFSSVPGPLDSPVETLYALTVECASLPTDFLGDAMSVIEKTKRWGMYPNYSILWDFVPFSFVVDWFVNIGSIADNAEIELRSQYFPIRYCMKGTRRTWKPDPRDLFPSCLGLSGSIDFRVYHRECTKELPLPSIQSEEMGSSPFKHWGEALALIVQKVR